MTLTDSCIYKDKIKPTGNSCFFSTDNTVMWLEYNSSINHCETFFQTSPESPGIYLLFHKLFGSQSVEELQSAAEAQGVTKDEFHVSHGASATYCCCIHVHNQDFRHLKN